MPAFLELPDPVADSNATGRVRYDRRSPTATTSMPPLLLLGGMTQTVASWSGHLRPLGERCDVVAYETRGQGQTELSLHDCSFARHVDDFAAVLEALELRAPVDLCGFSFGGRVALAIAARRPDLVRRLVLGGVAFDRGVVGRLIVAGWRAALRTGDLETLARVSLPDILGPRYLEQNEGLIEGMIRATVTRNSLPGARALLESTLAPEGNEAFTPEALAPAVSCPALVLSGALDRLAPPEGVRALSEALRAEHVLVPDVGHTVAIEAPDAFRAALERFLDADA